MKTFQAASFGCKLFKKKKKNETEFRVKKNQTDLNVFSQALVTSSLSNTFPMIC